MTDRVRIGVVGTSWWADAMYLPALANHPLADVRGVVGGSRPAHTREFAARWNVPGAYDSLEAMLDAEPLDAVLVLTSNRSHVDLTLAAIGRGLHVLCEKPLAMSARQAREIVEHADRAGVITMVPFTYRFMPAARYVKELVDEGYLGRPYHLAMRYWTGYGRTGAYAWRFDHGEAGSVGVAGDIGSHWVYLARWYFGEIEAVTAVVTHLVPRAARPDGAPYEVADDAATIVLEFANGATGTLQVTSLAYEPGPFGQRHDWDLVGSGGTLHVANDWVRTQQVHGIRDGEPELRELPIPDRIWGGARREVVQDTYKDVFRQQDHMTRAFVTAVAEGRPASPDVHDGLAVQRVLEATAISAREGRRVRIAEIVDAGG
jgi:predicted dehydrogenase